MLKLKKPFLILLLVLLVITTAFLVCPKYISIFRHESVKNSTISEQDEVVVFNFKTGKYHNPDCKYAKSCTRNCKTIKKSELPKDAKYSGYCRTHHSLKDTAPEKENNKIKKVSDYKSEATKTSPEPKPQLPKPATAVVEPLIPDVSTELIDLYFIDPIKYDKPASYCRTSACQALLREINNANESIDFAIYGIERQPEIFDALVNAQKRGIKVRWVTDMTEKNVNIYSDTPVLMGIIKTVNTDKDYFSGKEEDLKKLKFQQAAIMHNKFFVFDRAKVWTGSANISSTCLSGFNSNVGILIKSPQVAELFEKEFNQMYNGSFHTLKTQVKDNENIIFADKTDVSVYFSPEYRTISKKIVPLVNESKEYVYIPIFFLTHKDLTQSLVDAKNRGVDVKIIVDATSAQGEFTSQSTLREAGIPVKVENWAGKMHMKSIIIDDKNLVIGSMNLTNQGENRNDENTVIIRNNPTLAVGYKKYFLKLWNSIPDKWLYAVPKPEGSDSIGSCFDGTDNDFDGYIDNNDYDCKKLNMTH